MYTKEVHIFASYSPIYNTVNIHRSAERDVRKNHVFRTVSAALRRILAVSQIGKREVNLRIVVHFFVSTTLWYGRCSGAWLPAGFWWTVAVWGFFVVWRSYGYGSSSWVLWPHLQITGYCSTLLNDYCACRVPNRYGELLCGL